MSEAMMTFGDFVFSLPTLAFQDLSRRVSWGWAANASMGDLDDGQFTGKRDDVISVGGYLVPQVAGRASSLDRLREIGDAGEVRALVGGDGTVFGPYAVTVLDERRSNLYGDGTARRYDFQVEFRRQRDDAMLDPSVKAQGPVLDEEVAVDEPEEVEAPDPDFG